ncbi:hypothetical protein ZIOFF_024080 [Zingiber officinale]|uniref:Uncharacterized protein n=1 Tax=Zingiber officinale TaxID=94328 RepID=A0A8J5H7H0_ZINOF|nr:hypothetical protein ZIOFF_024080 [Zingiber officinale]
MPWEGKVKGGPLDGPLDRFDRFNLCSLGVANPYRVVATMVAMAINSSRLRLTPGGGFASSLLFWVGVVGVMVVWDGFFRALSDQFYRTPEHHKFVRDQVVDQLKSHREVYEGYVPMSFDEYLRKISGEWGDHVTLQAAADSEVFPVIFSLFLPVTSHSKKFHYLVQYGVKIFILTSFKDTCYIEILPSVEKSKREFPAMECKKKKRWWHFGI